MKNSATSGFSSSISNTTFCQSILGIFASRTSILAFVTTSSETVVGVGIGDVGLLLSSSSSLSSTSSSTGSVDFRLKMAQFFFQLIEPFVKDFDAVNLMDKILEALVEIIIVADKLIQINI